MSKFTKEDIRDIQTCIKTHYLDSLKTEVERYDFNDSNEIYKTYKEYMEAAERLMQLVESLKLNLTEEEKSCH